MARTFSRLPDIRINIFSVAACLALLAAPCVAWANATNFRDMSNNIVVGCRLPPPLITQLLWLMASGGALAMVVAAAYAYRARKHVGVIPKRYALAAMLPFYIAPVAIYLILAVKEGFHWGPFMAIVAILGVMSVCLSPIWLGVAAFHRRLMNLPEGARARPAKFGFAALAMFTLLTFSLPYAEGMRQTAMLLVWLMGAAAFVTVLLMAFRDNARWRRGGAAVLAAIALSALLMFWNRSPYEAAEFAFEQRDYDKAIAIIKPLAEKFDVKAAYKLGKYYTDEYNPKPDYVEGFIWFTYAAGKGHAKSAWILASSYLWGRNGKVAYNGEKALFWLEKAAEMGQPDAQSVFADYYLEGKDGFPQDANKGIELLEKAAQQGEWFSYRKLYWTYRKGVPGQQPDFERAYFWYLMWAAHGLVMSCPNTDEKEAGDSSGEMFNRDTIEKDCKDKQLIPLMTPAQIESAIARYKAAPKPPHYNPYFDND